MSCFKRVCRLCLERSDDYTSVFVAVEPGLPITVLLKALFPDLYTGLSMNPVICQNCLVLLKSSYNFRLKCMRTENLIGMYLRESRCTALCINLEDVVHYWAKNDPKLNNSGKDLLTEPTPMSAVEGKVVLNSKLVSLINMDLMDRAKDALKKSVKTYEKNKPGNKPIAEMTVPNLPKDPLEIKEEENPQHLPGKSDQQSVLKEPVIKPAEGNLKESENMPPNKDVPVVGGNCETKDPTTGKPGQKLSEEAPKERIRIRSDLELKNVRTLNHELYPQSQLLDKEIPTIKVIMKSSQTTRALMNPQPNLISFRQFVPFRQYKKILPRTPVENSVAPQLDAVVNDKPADSEEHFDNRLLEGESCIDIKEEPLRGSENDLSCGSTASEETTSASESYLCEKMLQEKNSNKGVQNIIDNIPEVSEDTVDVPDYVQINKISYEDLAKMCKGNKLHTIRQQDAAEDEDKTPSPYRKAGHRTRKRLRLVAVDASELQAIKRKKLRAVPPKTKRPSPAADDVVVLYTNISYDGYYMNDHDYLISPYRRNDLFFTKWNRCFCLCLLCGQVQEEFEHVDHMQRHRTVCDVCGVDYNNVFILNLHAKCHKVYCTNCKDVPGIYSKQILHPHCEFKSKEGEDNVNSDNNAEGTSSDGKRCKHPKYPNSATRKRRTATPKRALRDESKQRKETKEGKARERNKVRLEEKNTKLKPKVGEETQGSNEDEERGGRTSSYRGRTLRSRAKAPATYSDDFPSRRRSPRTSK